MTLGPRQGTLEVNRGRGTMERRWRCSREPPARTQNERVAVRPRVIHRRTLTLEASIKAFLNYWFPSCRAGNPRDLTLESFPFSWASSLHRFGGIKDRGNPEKG